jgi:hypothetical protein
VPIATAWEASTSVSRARHALATVLVPGTTRTLPTRRIVGSPGLTAPNAVGIPPPPLAGMQPMKGRKLGARAVAPTYLATKTTERDVVIPGFTGLPSFPMNVTLIPRSLRGHRAHQRCSRADR